MDVHFAQTRLQKALLCIGAFLLLLLATCWWWVPRATIAYLLHEVRGEQGLTLTPTQMQLSDAPVLQGRAYALEQLSFESPWSDESRAQSTPGYSVAYNFGPLQNGKYTRALTMLKDPSLRDGLLGHSKDLENFFGPVSQTNFALYDYLMRLTPSSVDVFASPADSMPKTILLTVKGNLIILGDHLFSFENKNGIKGFVTEKSASTTIAEFFTRADQEYTMILEGATAAERDSILNSLRESASSTTPKR